MSPSSDSELRSKWLKIALFIGLLGLLVGGSRLLPLQEALQQILTKIQQLGWRGPIVFVGIYILATILLLPGSILTLGSGVLFGLVWGSVYTFLGATVGAAFAFLIGRYLARTWVQQQIDRYPSFNAVSKAVSEQGFKIVFLTRLSPAFPFSLLNYAYGLTQVSFQDYLLASIGMIPGTLMYVYVGSLAGNLATLSKAQTSLSPQAQTWQLILQGLGLIATIAVTLYITRLARQALSQHQA